MFKICHKFDTKNHLFQYNWNKEACTTIRKDMLAKYEASIMYGEALVHEHACHVVKAWGGIKEAIQGQVVLQRNAVLRHNEVFVLAVQTRGSSQVFVTSMKVAKESEYL